MFVVDECWSSGYLTAASECLFMTVISSFLSSYQWKPPQIDSNPASSQSLSTVSTTCPGPKPSAADTLTLLQQCLNALQTLRPTRGPKIPDELDHEWWLKLRFHWTVWLISGWYVETRSGFCRGPITGVQSDSLQPHGSVDTPIYFTANH